MNICIKLFYIFFKIGLFSFGGGYAMLPLIRKEIIINNSWISLNEFTDLIAISQATPGPISTNCATYVGYKVAGFKGSLFCNLGIVLPSFIIMLIITKFFLKFKKNKYIEDALLILRPTTIGLIASAALLIAPNSFIDYKSIFIFITSFILFHKYNADPILITIIAGFVGLILY